MSLIKKHESIYVKENTNEDIRFYSSPFGGDIQIFDGALKMDVQSNSAKLHRAAEKRYEVQ